MRANGFKPLWLKDKLNLIPEYFGAAKPKITLWNPSGADLGKTSQMLVSSGNLHQLNANIQVSIFWRYFYYCLGQCTHFIYLILELSSRRYFMFIDKKHCKSMLKHTKGDKISCNRASYLTRVRLPSKPAHEPRIGQNFLCAPFAP